MKSLVLNLFLLFIGCLSCAAQSHEGEIEKLKLVLNDKAHFDTQKQKRIDQLKAALDRDPELDLNAKYLIYLKLYNEYKSFKYDKAFYYAHQLQKVSNQLKDPAKIAYAKLKLGFILLSSGMFKETFDSLSTLRIKHLPDSVKREYYFLTARTYYDLADFDKDDYYTRIYNTKASLYVDSAIRLCDIHAFDYTYYSGLKLIKAGDLNNAILKLKSLISSNKLSEHQYAIATSTLSDIYIQNNNPGIAISLLVEASIADIKSSTKEAAAMLNLAQLLNKRSNIQDAYLFIREAMDDAVYYGARQRKVQVSAILPVIASARILHEQEQKRMLFFYSSLLTLLSITIIVFAVIIYKQLKKIKASDKLIVRSNAELRLTIEKLNEAEKIKEEYIGYYLNVISDHMNKLEKIKFSIEQRLTTKKFDEIKILVGNINLKKEREELFSNFDKAFLKLFPNFVTEFNALFPAEHQVKLLQHQLLNTDLRIFALIRLGVNDTDKVARILEYSLSTIYNYRTRIKNKSNNPDGFEAAIMAIRAV
ncbi:DNA-binding CsgD family transcriptional regulator [Pedobacter cryoconitis]|uniref:DNA-binding CsgD family transcriptional regulator n=1 Tax=Pedobacter cryoconitis TaxID=188932 RepID=A0A7W9DXH3_9SPHI|nr:DUF6377 domain-containing protein [Pedobacter cryoconitis]MBB5635122.1 DNA-binding CsgD family transcriptional regulator [Pedobacter cryoconitis]